VVGCRGPAPHSGPLAAPLPLWAMAVALQIAVVHGGRCGARRLVVKSVKISNDHIILLYIYIIIYIYSYILYPGYGIAIPYPSLPPQPACSPVLLPPPVFFLFLFFSLVPRPTPPTFFLRLLLRGSSSLGPNARGLPKGR
jgi:hypothetical protein